MQPAHLVVVPHTHWDREWYRTHEQFRYQLVGLLDRLLDLLESDPEFRHFTLDGQTIVLDDYLEVRPEARPRIEALVRSGRLLVGPWYVLPDEWLVSGEALIRNLRLGLSHAHEFGAAMELGYVPDQFGHVGQLPQVFAGFGFDAAVMWRGVGEDVDRTLFQWQAPDGTELLAVYLLRGYGNASNLPMDGAGLAERLRLEIGALAPRSPIASLLLMNGSDHQEPQPQLPTAIDSASRRLGAEIDTIEIGTLPGFVARARAECREPLAVHRGELRSGLRSPLLPGCASTRLPQKRADFHNDRLLTRYLEPLAAWLQVLGEDPDRGVIDLAWRTALQNHPHDSICGCSVDAVHEQMESRFARVHELASSHLEHVLSELAGRIRASNTGGGEPIGGSLVVWNPGVAGATVVEGDVELDVASRRPQLHLRDAEGSTIGVDAVRVEPGEVLADYALPATVISSLVQGFPPEFMGRHVAALEARHRRGRLEVEARFGNRPAGFDFDQAKAVALEALAGEGAREARFRARRWAVHRLRFVAALPGTGLRVLGVRRGRARASTPAKLFAEVRDRGAELGNETWRIRVEDDGRVELVHRPSGLRLSDAIRIESEGDRGDEYNFDPVPGAEPVRSRAVRVRLSPLRHSHSSVSVTIDLVLRVPRELALDRSRRSSRAVSLRASMTLRVFAGVDRIDVDVRAENVARDHRLRVYLRGPADADRFEVESAFEVAARPIEPPPDAFGSDRPAERPAGATPQRAFATLAGRQWAATVANRGSAEVEAVRGADGEASLAITLLRAIGWLSRGDLQRRPGHAGPPLATPGAQVPGTHRAELSYRLHPVDDLERAAQAHHFAFPPLLFCGGGEGGPLEDGARLFECDDPAIAVTAIEPAAHGPMVRVVNLSAETRSAEVGLAGAPLLEPVDLRGRPNGPALAHGSEGRAELTLRAWEIATLRATSSPVDRKTGRA